MCSNYGCGPDSFNGSFFRHIMENKPYAFIETDGHSGDAGTKTRIEAFLFCVDGDAALPAEERARAAKTDFAKLEQGNTSLLESQAAGDTMLIGRMGVASEALAALLRGEGMRAEALPVPTGATLDLGRRYTSGKECLPMSVSLGSLLERLEASTDPNETFAVLVPSSEGPCRLGTYHLLYKIALQQAGWGDRVKILSPHTENYFAGLSPSFEVRFWTAVVAAETLYAAWEDVAPVETEPGAADRVWEQYHGELLALIEGVPPTDLWPAMREAAAGMNGIRELMDRAAAAFRAVKDFERDVPTVNVVGEIYVRLDPFSNGDIVKRLQRAGLRARTAPLHEWVEYVTWWNRFRMANGMTVPGDSRVGLWVTAALQEGVAATLYAVVADALEWGQRPVPAAAVDAAAPYADHDLSTETNLTLGTAIHEYLAGEADGAVSVGPLECMPNKIAESHFERVDADLGLPSVTFNMSGEPVDQAAVDAFAYEVRERWDRNRAEREPAHHPKTSWSDLAWTGSGRLLFRVLRAIGSGGGGGTETVAGDTPGVPAEPAPTPAP
jgi:predicted nucleotide-binding protein (sugar kinase/HSP70/actin superfamily)